MRYNLNEPKHCVDVDDNMVKEFEQSELGRVVGSRLTSLPSSKMLMVSNPNSARGVYFDYMESK